MEIVRQIGHADIADVLRLSTDAGWNQLAEDWHRMFDLAPDGCYGMDADGAIRASSTAIVYPGLAWIGMVLTSPEYRGRGFARAVMEQLIERLPVDRSRLDATDLGRPLYLKLGYVDEYPVERWIRPASAACAAIALPAFHPDLIALDTAAFGYDRGILLARLATESRTWSVDNGFAFTRAGRNARFFGPCVVATEDGARQLLRAFLADFAGEPVFWDLCPENASAARLARECGFQPVRHLMRMRRGPADAFTTPSPNVYAMAGFEFG